ncbi:MAG: putative LPS assembly protein LptD [Bacteroidota bacterium]
MVLGVWLICFPSLIVHAQVGTATETIPDSALAVTTLQDTLPKDSLLDPRQQLLDSLKLTSDLKERIVYNASDSIIFDVDNDMLFLYGDASIDYESTKLRAAKIRVDWSTETLFAEGVVDENGVETGTPIFTEKGQDYNAQKMAYNFNTGKARIVAARSQQQPDITIISDTTKRLKDGTMFARDVIFTTCDCPPGEEPSFYFKAKKVKVLPNNQIVTGPLRAVLEGFPLPIIIPFGFVPNMKDGQRSGVIFPQYGEARERGFFLRNGGYYFGLGDNLDLLLNGDIYTRGGWRVGLTTTYNKRYRYQGRLSFDYGIVRFNEPTDPDFSKTREWRLTWSHNQPINPTTSITSNVNITSRAYLRQVSLNSQDFFQNNLNSSVSFQKRFNNLPFSINGTVSHRQDLNKNTMSLELPTINLTMNRITPFKNLSTKKSLRWLTQLGINYNAQAANRITTIPSDIFPDILFSPRDTFLVPEISGTDTVFVNRPGTDFIRNGIIQRASTSTNIKLFNYINLSGSVSFNEYWYSETIERTYNAETDEVEETTVPGFAAARDYSSSVGLSTNFFGIYQFTGPKQFAIRQRFTPTVSYNIRPDFSDPRFGFYETVQNNAEGDPFIYSRFADGIFGGPGRGESQAVGFSLTSVLEMKYRKKESYDEDFPEKEDKFIRANLLDNLGISGNYNIAADSFKLSNLRLNARTQLFEKINLNASGTLNPYAIETFVIGQETDEITQVTNDITQERFVDRLVFRDGKLGRLTNAQISLSGRFSSKRKRDGSKNEDTVTEEETQILSVQPLVYTQYVDFDIPWSMNLGYNLSYNNRLNADPGITQTLRASGNLSFTSKWQVNLNTGYDFQRNEVTNTTVSIRRDLDCWDLSFSWTPFGTLQAYFLKIQIKSGTLQDLVKVKRQSRFQDRRF